MEPFCWPPTSLCLWLYNSPDIASPSFVFDTSHLPLSLFLTWDPQQPNCCIFSTLSEMFFGLHLQYPDSLLKDVPTLNLHSRESLVGVCLVLSSSRLGSRFRTVISSHAFKLCGLYHTPLCCSQMVKFLVSWIVSIYFNITLTLLNIASTIILGTLPQQALNF